MLTSRLYQEAGLGALMKANAAAAPCLAATPLIASPK